MMGVTPEFVLDVSLYVLIAFGITAFALTIGAAVVFKGHNLSGESLALIVERSEVAKLATVVLIVLAVTFLGLLKLIAGEAVVAVLSGIAGYVLGGQAIKGSKSKQNGE